MNHNISQLRELRYCCCRGHRCQALRTEQKLRSPKQVIKQQKQQQKYRQRSNASSRSVSIPSSSNAALPVQKPLTTADESEYQQSDPETQSALTQQPKSKIVQSQAKRSKSGTWLQNIARNVVEPNITLTPAVGAFFAALIDFHSTISLTLPQTANSLGSSAISSIQQQFGFQNSAKGNDAHSNSRRSRPRKKPNKRQSVKLQVLLSIPSSEQSVQVWLSDILKQIECRTSVRDTKSRKRFQISATSSLHSLLKLLMRAYPYMQLKRLQIHALKVAIQLHLLNLNLIDESLPVYQYLRVTRDLAQRATAPLDCQSLRLEQLDREERIHEAVLTELESIVSVYRAVGNLDQVEEQKLLCRDLQVAIHAMLLAASAAETTEVSRSEGGVAGARIHMRWDTSDTHSARGHSRQSGSHDQKGSTQKRSGFAKKAVVDESAQSVPQAAPRVVQTVNAQASTCTALTTTAQPTHEIRKATPNLPQPSLAPLHPPHPPAIPHFTRSQVPHWQLTNPADSPSPSAAQAELARAYVQGVMLSRGSFSLRPIESESQRAFAQHAKDPAHVSFGTLFQQSTTDAREARIVSQLPQLLGCGQVSQGQGGKVLYSVSKSEDINALVLPYFQDSAQGLPLVRQQEVAVMQAVYRIVWGRGRSVGGVDVNSALQVLLLYSTFGQRQAVSARQWITELLPENDSRVVSCLKQLNRVIKGELVDSHEPRAKGVASKGTVGQ